MSAVQKDVSVTLKFLEKGLFLAMPGTQGIQMWSDIYSKYIHTEKNLVCI